MKFPYITTAAVALLLLACNGQQDNTSDNTTWQAPTPIDTLLALDTRQEHNTIDVAGQQLTYTLTIAPDTLLPIVTNRDGQRYYDNTATLVISKDGTTLLNRTFHKDDFAQFVPTKEMPFSVLAGLTYDELGNEQHNDALRLIATVGDPDEANGVNFPVEIVVLPNGQLSLEQAEDIETAPLTPGLSESPEQ